VSYTSATEMTYIFSFRSAGWINDAMDADTMGKLGDGNSG